MASVHTISTLLYCFNRQNQVLLMERAKEPNFGVWSPPGGKLNVHEGESPYECACREATEELGIVVTPQHWHLAGIVTEAHHSGEDHWLMFLFELRWKLSSIPEAHREGRFEFFDREQLNSLKMPEADRTHIWPLFWKNRGKFFAARCRILPAGASEWIVEEDGSANH